MKLVVLSDIRAKKNLQAEHGLSFYIEFDKIKILFDAGASDIFLKNALKLSIALDTIDKVVLSHGHFDHGDGLQYLKYSTLYCHPECFVKRYRKNGLRNIGLSLSKHDIKKRFNLQQFREPYQLSEHTYFLGEIPRINDFEAQTTPYVKEGGAEDYVIDDSGLACVTEDGLVVVSGCAHSGICNMIEHAKEVTGVSKIKAVIGGFHLKSVLDQTLKTIEYMKQNQILLVFPSHCTMEPALSTFYKTFGYNEVMAGQEIFFE
jgi:7,8-dihydropterin-6-yl-methyl-4-(beta-D-ribofuranosyl)aminobenzene 5'-phosphate synthase